MTSRTKRRNRSLAAVMAVAVALAACSSDGDGDTQPEAAETSVSATESTSSVADTASGSTDTVEVSTSSVAGTASGSSDTVEVSTSSVAGTASGSSDTDLEALLSGSVEFPMPSEPVDPGGRKVAVVSLGLGSATQAVVIPMLEDAVKQIGWTAPPAGDGLFQPTVQAGLVEQAVLDGADAIFVYGIAPSTIPGAVEQAAAAGTPIICILCIPDPNAPDNVIYILIPPENVAAAQVAFALDGAGDDANIVVMRNAVSPYAAAQGAETLRLLDEQCPNCNVSAVDVTVEDTRVPGAPVLASVLEDHPAGELDVVIAAFDQIAGVLAQQAAQAGRSDFKIVGNGANPPFSDLVRNGDPLAGATGVLPFSYMFTSAVDLAARKLAGAEMWDATHLPLALATPDNWDELLGDDGLWEPDFDFRKTFGELWGQ